MNLRRKGLLLLFLLLAFSLYSEETPNKRLYSFEIVDKDGSTYKLNRASYISFNRIEQYFIWFRRGTEKAIVESIISFDRIKEIEFTGGYEVFPDHYTPCTMTLISNKSYPGFMDTSGYLGGIDQALDSYSLVYLQYNQIKSIKVKQLP